MPWLHRGLPQNHSDESPKITGVQIFLNTNHVGADAGDKKNVISLMKEKKEQGGWFLCFVTSLQ